MLTNFLSRNTRLAAVVLPALAAIFAGCAVNLPPPPSSNPADPHSPEAASAPLRPTLVATSRTFLAPAADDREQKAKQMDMGKMQQAMPGMQHDMKGRQPGHDMQGMPGMSDHQSPSPSPLPDKTAPPGAQAYYTCPMHSQIKEAKPGQCPICGMTLVKKTGGKQP